MKKIFIKFALFYIRVLAKIQLKKINPVVIGVGGASGKTSVSRFIYLILKEKYKVRVGFGKNSETGIPLSILNITIQNYNLFNWAGVFVLALLKVLFDWKKYDIFICEMGIDGPFEPKNMSYLLKIVSPELSVLTNISLEHSVYFDPLVKDEDFKKRKEKILDLISSQESLIVTSLGKNQTAVVNLDDSETIKILKNIKARVVSVSLEKPNADFYVKSIESSLKEFRLTFVSQKKEYEVKISNPLPNHFAYSFLQAIAVSLDFEFTIEEAITALEKNFSLPPGRMSVFEGVKNTTIIDSSYNNATLYPLLDILEMLKKIGEKNHRVAILGDMRELGSVGRELHEAVADKIITTCDLAIIIGPLMEQLVAPVLKKNKFNYYSYPNFSNAKKDLLNIISENDLILVKSSQNTLFLERAVEMLLKNPKDSVRLCRRGEFWDKKREKSL